MPITNHLPTYMEQPLEFLVTPFTMLGEDKEQLYSKKIESIAHREIISCPSDLSIYQAANMMSANKVSCLFIKDQQNKIIGYVTDITLRDNVVAKKCNLDLPIGEVMDKPLVSIPIKAYVYEAIFLMFQTKTRYLLIEKDGQYCGFISRNKLLSEHAQSPMAFIQSVKLATSCEEFKKKWEKVPSMVTQLLGRGVHVEIVNQVITTLTDTITQKVIEGVIEEMGPPPAKFVFMVLGSEGRKEQTLRTDQDNAIIYEDKTNEQREQVRTYFLNFATMVSERLNDIGFSHCPGGYTAKNSKWTHSLSHWKSNYTRWMEESLPQTVMKFSTFFDCRYIYGDISIMQSMQVFLSEALKKPLDKLFFYMAKNALQYTPPLTYFNNIKTKTLGSKQVFDIKKAMTPIVDLVRVYALKHSIFEVNTGERLKALRKLGVFTNKELNELMLSYHYLMGLRLRTQAYQIMNGQLEPVNYIDIRSLTRIEQVTLKAIFKTIENFQTGIKIKFTNNMFG